MSPLKYLGACAGRYEEFLVWAVARHSIAVLSLPDDPLNVHLNSTDEDLRSKYGVRVGLLGGTLEISREAVRLDILSSRAIGEMEVEA